MNDYPISEKLSSGRPVATLGILNLLIVLLLPFGAIAQTSWKGTANTDWRNAANWTAGVPTATLSVVIGDTNFTGPNQPALTARAACKSLTIGAGNKASALTAGQNLTVSGDIVIGANGTLTQNGRTTLSLSGNWRNLGTYSASNTRAVVVFAGTAQTLNGVTAFRKLTVNAGATVTLSANISVANQLAISGTFDPGESPAFIVSGGGKLSVNSGGTLRVKAATFAGNYALTGTKTLNASSTVDYGASTQNQTVSSSLTYGTLRISGGKIKTLAANLPALNSSVSASGNITVAAGVFDLSTFTANRGTTVAGGSLVIGNGATLSIGGTGLFPLNFASHTLGLSSMVIYAGANQGASLEKYGNLVFSSAGGTANKTIAAGTLTIGGSLIITNGAGTSVSFTAAGATTIAGNLTIGLSSTFSAGNFAHGVGGSWSNNGTFAGGTGSITFNGSGQTLGGTGANNFNDLIVTGPGFTVSSGTSLSIAGNLATVGSGTFLHSLGGPGSVTLTGTAKTISGNSIAFNHLAVSGSLSTSSSLTIAGNLNVTGSFAATAGTISLTGNSASISGSGALSFSGLNVPGNITSATGFSIASDFSVSGTFAASAGTVTFTGSSILSGSPNLFNVALNGTRLQLGPNSVLGIGGAFTVVTGVLDATTTLPNTVNYNGPGAQTLKAGAYYNLSLSGAGNKTAGGTLLVSGDLSIGSSTTFVPGTFPHTLAGNWANRGAFLGSGSTVQLIGGNDAFISGVTTFDTLTVAKSSGANVVTLLDNVSAATLNMTNGEILTGTNTVTITSTRTGSGIILGTIIRSHPFLAGTPYAFESPNNTITFASLGTISSVSVTVSPRPVLDFPSGGAVNRQYAISLISSGAYASTLRLHYADSELNGSDEATLRLWHFQNPWTLVGKTANDSTNDWVEQSSLTDITGRWALSDALNVAHWNGSVGTAWELPANWTAIQGVPQLPPSTNDIANLGDTAFGNQPTLSSSAQLTALSFGSAQAVTLNLALGGSLAVGGNAGLIAANWTNTVTHTINVASQTLTVGGALLLSDGTNGHAVNVNLDAGTVSVAGDLTESGGANITISGAGQLNLGGNFNYSSGTFTAGGSTVSYTGTAAQVVAGGITYNNLAFNKPTGAATLASAANVSADLILTNAGIVGVHAPLAVAGNVVVSPGSTLDGDSSSIAVGGNWSMNGTFVSRIGSVLLNGTGTQVVSATTFNQLAMNKPAGRCLLAGNLIINSDLNLSAGQLDLGTFTANRSSSGGTLTLGPAATLRIGTGGGFPAGFGVNALDSQSSVDYYSSSNQVVAANIYGNLFIENSGTKSLAGNSVVAGDLVIGPGATFDGGAVSLNVGGNWTNGGTFSPSSSSVTLSGTGKTLSGPTLFNNLAITGTYLGSSDLTVNGQMNVSGAYDAGNTVVTLFGNLANSGTVSSSGTVSFMGTGPQSIALNSGFSSSGVVNFNGSVAPSFSDLTAPLFQNVNINNTAGVAPSLGWSVTGDFSVSAGALFLGGGSAHVFQGAFLNSGTVSSSGVMVFAPQSAEPINLNGASFTSSGLVVFGGSGLLTIGGGPQVFNSVTVSNTNPAGVTPSSNWTLGGDIQVTTGAILNGGAGLTHTVSGNWSDNGAFNGQSSTVVLAGSSDISGSGSTTFNNLVTTGAAAAVNDFNISGNFTNNGSFDGTASTVAFTGLSPATIGGSTSPTLFGDLVISKVGVPVVLGINLTNLTAVAVMGGTFELGASSLLQDSSGGALTIGPGATIRIGGANTLPLFNSYAFDPVSTVEYSGSGNQTIAAANYGGLVSSSTGARILAPAGTIGIAGTFTPGPNSYTNTGSTIDFNGTGAQTIPAFNYFNFTTSASGSRTLSPTGTIGIAALFTPGANPFVVTGSTVSFDGSSQTIPVFTYNNLSVAGTGTKTLAGDVLATGSFSLASAALADAGHVLTVNGGLSLNGAYTGAGRILLAGGAAPHSLSGTAAYNDLELNDPAGAALNGTNLNVTGTLRLTAGLILTDTNQVIIGTTGIVARAAGYVAGNLQKNIPTGSTSETFEVGDPTNYAPVIVNFGTVSTAGKLTASTTPMDYPGIASAGINAAKSVNRYWLLANNGVAFDHYALTLSYVASDVDPGSNPVKFIVGLHAAGAWSLPSIVSNSSTSIQVTNVAAFGDFVVGESASPGQFTSVQLAGDGNPTLNFNGNPGQSYRIQATTSLAAPILWSSIATNTADANGLIQLHDITATNYPARFYRSVTP